MTPVADRYLQAVSQADVSAAAATLEEALRSGLPPAQLLRDVLVPAQRRAGELWFAGRWTVADEHAATAVTEQVLPLLLPVRSTHAPVARLELACAEGEWHSMPARFAAQLARLVEVDVVFLGAGLPAAQLRSRLATTVPDALALSCTMPTNLLGAARSIAAAHDVGVPVVVGGAAWGSGQRRAHAMGAELHLSDPADLAGLLPQLAGLPLRERAPFPAECLLLDVPETGLLRVPLERLDAALPTALSAFARERALEDLGWLSRFTAAAVACDDRTVLSDFLGWLLALLAPRGVPGAVVLDSCRYLADAIESVAPRGATLLRSEADLSPATEEGTRR